MTPSHFAPHPFSETSSPSPCLSQATRVSDAYPTLDMRRLNDVAAVLGKVAFAHPPGPRA